jgi:flavin-dependent dehydrogenase
VCSLVTGRVLTTEPIADVLVIGGGPAGSTAAALLATAGRRVTLFEKERFPRFHIGESLLPFNVPLFRRLGIADAMTGRYVKKWGGVILSSDGAHRQDLRFANGLIPGHPMAFHVLRSSFDELLLRNAAARGAVVHEGATVVAAETSHRAGCEVTVRGGDGRLSHHRGRFLLDASGTDAFLGSRRGLRRMARHLRKAAVFAHYESVARDVAHDPGDIILVVLRDGWFWLIPLSDTVTSVGLVTEGATVKDSKLAPADLLEESLRRCVVAGELVRDAKRVSPVWTASDYSYDCRDIAGDGYLLVGDAAAFIDPIFSSGVWLAMSSAELAADAVDRALGRPGRKANLAPAVFRRYERAVRRRVGTYLAVVERFYRPGFMDLFFHPAPVLGMREAVTSVLAGLADPPAWVQVRLWIFYLFLWLQRRFRLVAPVALQSVMEPPGVDGSVKADGSAAPARASS